MSNVRFGKPRSRMLAGDDDPWVSVSLLGESLFCDRAGRFQYEKSRDDTGEEPDIAPPRRGWYRPPFSVAEIEHELARLIPRICVRAGLMLAALMVLLLSRWDGLPAFLLVAASLVAAVSAIRGTLAWMGLRLLLRTARNAETAEPDPNLRQPTEISWWSMLRHGFETHRYEDPLSDQSWRVTGKPWRVLHKGSLRVPVFRKKNEDTQLYRQHFARIAAYAHLIERSQGAKVPYGIILLGSSYRGMAVPVDPGSSKQFHDAVLSARAIIKGGTQQAAPANPTRCRACPWGKPMTTDRGHSYQSPCGERYGWVPPHQKAIGKGLV